MEYGIDAHKREKMVMRRQTMGKRMDDVLYAFGMLLDHVFSHGTDELLAVVHFYIMTAPFEVIANSQFLGPQRRGIIEPDDLPLP